MGNATILLRPVGISGHALCRVRTLPAALGHRKFQTAKGDDIQLGAAAAAKDVERKLDEVFEFKPDDFSNGAEPTLESSFFDKVEGA